MEIEAKIKITAAEAKALLVKVLELSVVSNNNVVETNSYYDLRGSILSKKGKTFRVRRTVYFSSDWKTEIAVSATVTIKGLIKKKHKFKARPENNYFFLSDKAYDGITGFIEEVGFRHLITYTKRRHIIRTKSLEICFDKLPKLGWFIEIEGDSASIESCLKHLGLDKRKTIKQGYHSLLKKGLS